MNALHPQSRNGFTLLEVLVATLAYAILLTAVYGVFAHAQRLRDGAEVRTRDARLQARAVDLLRRDLQQALVLAGPIASTLHGDPQGAGSSYPGYLALTTTTGRTQDDTIGSDVQEVEYYLESEEDGGVLVRTVQRVLLTDVPDPPRVQPLLHQVNAMSVSFYDGDQWLDQWDSTVSTNELPRAVRVRLERVSADDPDEEASPVEILVPWTTTPVGNDE